MRTIKLTIEYDGTNYAGWQIQPHKMTIQQRIQDLLKKITGEEIQLRGASRTDAGVHALGQVAHFKTRSKISCRRLLRALNGLLPGDISVKKVQKVGDHFHAQDHAKRKVYRYLIWNDSARAALLNNRAWHVWTPLNHKTMSKASQYLIGKHDFSAFRAAQSSTKTSVRKVESISIRRGAVPAPGQGNPAPTISITITGTGFLKYMVRNIVGTLVDVGKGKLSPEEFGKILKSKDRKKAGVTAPARGLYLMKIAY